MMNSLRLCAGTIVLSLGIFAEAHAQYGYHSVCDGCRAGYHANAAWPSRYVPAARRSIYSAYDAVINNGWRRQNLIGTYHFDPETHELTDAGKLKVNWILTQAPQHRRSIFVQRGLNQSETATRVASVHSWTADMSPNIGQADVNDTHIVAEGQPAVSVDSVFTGFHTNRPPPVLPSAGGGGSSSGAASN